MIVSAMLRFLQWVPFMIIWILLIVQQRRPFAHVFHQSTVNDCAVFYISYTGMSGTLLKLAICQQADSHSDNEIAIEILSVEWKTQKSNALRVNTVSCSLQVEFH